MTGKRKTIYIQARHKWLFNAIAQVKKEAAKISVPVTDSDVIVDCMLNQLEDYRRIPPVSPSVPTTRGRLKRSVTCPAKYKWVFERVEDIVEIKKQLGFKASFSSELVALAANGLQSENEYGTIVKQMLAQASGK